MKVLIGRFLCALALCVVTLLLAAFGPTPQLDETPGVVMRVPTETVAGLYSRIGEDPKRYMSEEELKWLPPDTEVVRQTYYPISSYGLREYGVDYLRMGVVLARADSRSLHRPEVCLPGQGWDIKGSTIISIPMGEDQVNIDVKVLDLEQTVDYQGELFTLNAQYWYWWEGVDRRTPSSVERSVFAMMDALLKNRIVRWAYPSLMLQISSDDSVPLDTRRERAIATGRKAIQDWTPMLLRSIGATKLTAEEQAEAMEQAVPDHGDDE